MPDPFTSNSENIGYGKPDATAAPNPPPPN